MNTETIHTKLREDYNSSIRHYNNLKRMLDNYTADTSSYEGDFVKFIDEMHGNRVEIFGRRFLPSYVLQKLDPYMYNTGLLDFAKKQFENDKTTDKHYCQLLQDFEEAESDLHDCKTECIKYGYTFD